MAKRKGIETKAALLQQHFKGEIQKTDENELGDWSKENIQKIEKGIFVNISHGSMKDIKIKHNEIF